MTWYGNEPALEFTNIDDLRAYIQSLDYRNWRPSNFTVHNTASPTLYQWWHSVPPEQRMENLQHYYEHDMGWSSGPHFFIDGKSWWCMTPPNVRGVHSPSWNSTMLGFEHVGDYETESATSGMGAEVQRMGHELSAVCCAFFGWNPEALKFHYEDPNTDHACPGSNMSKSSYIDAVQQVMGEGGDDGQRPSAPRRGTVYGVAEGDKLNIRASSSSSSVVIGMAENGDVLTVVGEAWNGSTKWLRIKVGREAGPDVAIYGWCSAAYVDVRQPATPLFPLNQCNITATVFQDSSTAYPPYDAITDTELSCSLPGDFEHRPPPMPMVEVVNVANGQSVITTIRDIGPYFIDDYYWETQKRPEAEPAGSTISRGKYEGDTSNGAGIDLTPGAARALGIDGKGIVNWRFIEPN